MIEATILTDHPIPAALFVAVAYEIAVRIFPTKKDISWLNTLKRLADYFVANKTTKDLNGIRHKHK